MIINNNNNNNSNHNHLADLYAHAIAPITLFPQLPLHALEDEVLRLDVRSTPGLSWDHLAAGAV